MIDLSQTVVPKSDQLNADDLIGGPQTLVITDVRSDPSSADQPVSIWYQGDDNRPYKPCKSMRRVLIQVWGKDGAAYVGRRMTIYRDPKVKWGGIEVGGVRISHMSHMQGRQTLNLTVTRGQKKPYIVQPLADGIDVDALFSAAADRAKHGRDAFMGYWKELDEGQRTALKPRMNEIEKISIEADAKKSSEDDPFKSADQQAEDDMPSAEDLARAEEAAMAAMKERDAALTAEEPAEESQEEEQT